MNDIRTSFRLSDGVSSPAAQIVRSLNNVKRAYESVEESNSRMSKGINSLKLPNFSAFEKLLNLPKRMKLPDFNSASKSASEFTSTVNGAVKALGALKGIDLVFDFAIGSMDAANIQNNVENQLKGVMQNAGASYEDYAGIKDYASQIQSQGIYGDEAMIGGAAELATYMSDPEAIKSMMGTLADYAAGMSGGGAVDQSEMVNYATQLGKALNGSYDGLTKKGFQLTDAQKEIIENGSDMEKALVINDVIAESWEDLYETMSNTPQGQILQMQNAFGDVREEIGNQLLPVVAEASQSIASHMDEVKDILEWVASGVGVVIRVFGKLADVGIPIIASIKNGLVNAAGTMLGAFGTAVNGVQGFFYDMKASAITVIADIAAQLSKLPFVNIDYEGMYAEAETYRQKAEETRNGEGAGDKIVQTVKDLFTFPPYDNDAGEWNARNVLNDIADNTSETASAAKNASNALSVNLSDLKYLKELSSQKSISSVTNAQIHLDMSGMVNSIASDMDIDGVVSTLENKLEEALLNASEGAHVYA